MTKVIRISTIVILLGAMALSTNPLQAQAMCGDVPREGFSASPVGVNNKVFFTNDQGTTFVIANGPEFKLLGVNNLKERPLASPALVDGRWYWRTDTRLLCIGKKSSNYRAELVNVEEILIIVLQILFEVGLEMLFWVGVDFTAWSVEKKKQPGSFGCGTMFILFAIGAACGALTNWIYERPLLPYDWLRIVNLIVGPLVAGGAGWLIAEWRRQRGTAISPSLHFWIGFWFVFGFDLIRFAYAKRDLILR